MNASYLDLNIDISFFKYSYSPFIYLTCSLASMIRSLASISASSTINSAFFLEELVTSSAVVCAITSVSFNVSSKLLYCLIWSVNIPILSFNSIFSL